MKVASYLIYKCFFACIHMHMHLFISICMFLCLIDRYLSYANSFSPVILGVAALCYGTVNIWRLNVLIPTVFVWVASVQSLGMHMSRRLNYQHFIAQIDKIQISIYNYITLSPQRSSHCSRSWPRLLPSAICSCKLPYETCGSKGPSLLSIRGRDLLFHSTHTCWCQAHYLLYKLELFFWR